MLILQSFISTISTQLLFRQTAITSILIVSDSASINSTADRFASESKSADVLADCTRSIFWKSQLKYG